jgi:hypothetical protein
MDNGILLERIWESLLSREDCEIVSTFKSLDDSSKREVISHLNRMVTEPGWHPEQVKSARAALKALSETTENGY